MGNFDALDQINERVRNAENRARRSEDDLHDLRLRYSSIASCINAIIDQLHLPKNASRDDIQDRIAQLLKGE